jgi:hypothetical protein
MVEVTGRLVWSEQSGDFWRSACGRFDVFRSADEDRGDWVALDCDLGRTHRSAGVGAAMRWCEGRAAESAAAERGA